MNWLEFRAALSALVLAVEIPAVRKPKSIIHAAEAYRRGTKGMRRHVEELKSMTLEQLFDLSYDLYKGASDGNGNEDQENAGGEADQEAAG